MNGSAHTQNHPDQRDLIARQGLRLPLITLRQLKATGIYCQPTLSIEHQHLARKYVLRGVECGGAVAELGIYCGFVDDQGAALSWLQRVDSIAPNGVHAIVVAPVLIRIEMLRIERTYDLLITRHSLSELGKNQRPQLTSSILFYGRRGSLELELWGKDSRFGGSVSPVFYTRSGEAARIPAEFQEPVSRITAAVCCLGCRHCHLLQPKPIFLSMSGAASSEDNSSLTADGHT